MKLIYKTEDQRLAFEITGEDQRDLFSQLAACQEIFENRCCGACDSSRVRFQVRENSGNFFYELRCLDCGSTMAFGQKRSDGSLFPKRKDKEGNWLPGNGWVKWQPKEDF